nr:MAG: ORF1 [TTV-like mini virus]
MPPFQRRRYYFNNYYNWRRKWRKRRFPTRRRRPRFSLRKRKRSRRVRRHFYTKNFKRKLKKLRLNQWQPSSIKKCKIQGYLCLFQTGRGRYGNLYTLSRDSFIPEHEPGGGGWSIQQLSLSTLYIENNNLMNWWTRSNNHLNLCRYAGCKITLFRQETTDYIFTYIQEQPKTVSKYYYCTFHPMKLLLYNHKVIVPSMQTQPHKKKNYKTIFIPPPNLMKNQWFFQQNLCQFPLITIAATATSLNTLFGSNNAQNNNVSINCLNIRFFTSPLLQYKRDPFKTDQNKYIYTIQRQDPPIQQYKYGQLTAVAQTMLNEPGFSIFASGKTQPQDYTATYWGNIFYYEYFTMQEPTYISDKDINFVVTNRQNQIDNQYFKLKTEPYYVTVRYNPFKDKGKGNLIYWVPNSVATKNNWEPLPDPDLQIGDYPLWILLWGWEDMTKRIGKCKNLDNDWILVIRSSYLSETFTAYVPLSEAFIHGQGPYDVDRSEIKGQDQSHWYPRYRYQREAINSIIMSAPGVCRGDHTRNIQSFIKYKFFFKWGGNPADIENVYDPMSQPITPTPNNIFVSNEINDPATDIKSFIYKWDTRRDLLTQTAADRIKKSELYDSNLFTDGRQTATDLQFQVISQETSQKETQETQEAPLQQQLYNVQQLNQQLQLRFNKLKSYIQNL